MAGIFTGRYAAHTDDSFVLFIIGISIHRPWAIRQWWGAFTAMPAMMNELSARPELGMISSRLYFSFPELMMVQYWRSFDHLEAFARNPQEFHLPAWQKFNKAVGKSKAVGVYHETYIVQAGQYEAVYVNMPRMGLAKAFEHLPAHGHKATARRRLGGESEIIVKEMPAETAD